MGHFCGPFLLGGGTDHTTPTTISAGFAAFGKECVSTPSRMAATPMPPAVQIEIKHRLPPLLCSSLASTAKIRAPVAAKGCPQAIDEPLTLSFARSIDPSAPLRPRRRRQ